MHNTVRNWGKGHLFFELRRQKTWCYQSWYLRQFVIGPCTCQPSDTRNCNANKE